VRVFFCQIYIEPGISFPFSHHFQRRMSDHVTSLVSLSPEFEKRYGLDWDVTINVSAKEQMENEIRGPTVFRKNKDVEYSVFLPFSAISEQENQLHAALAFLFGGTYSALEALGLDTSRLRDSEHSTIRAILADATMVKVN
jgi:hypothetical protein